MYTFNTLTYPWEISNDVIHLRIQTPWPSLNAVKGWSFWEYKRERKVWQELLFYAFLAKESNTKLRDKGTMPWDKVLIQANRRSASRLMDWDNLMGGLKPIFDCMTMESKNNPDGMGWIKDDSPNTIIQCPYLTQEVSGHKDKGCEIFIYRLDKKGEQ